MKLSHFLSEHKKNLKKLTRKKLIEQILIGLDMNANQWLAESIRYDDLYDELTVTLEELKLTQHRLAMNEGFLKSAESAIRMYENMSVFKFLIHKYRK